MSVCIDAAKQMNLVDFLREHYGLIFKRSGSGYVASSPLSADKRPSFFVRKLNGRWLFKDFSSGLGGSIIDLVGHLESLTGVKAVLERIEKMLGGTSVLLAEQAGKAPAVEQRGYDIHQLYERFSQQDPQVCRQYLVDRGISQELVDALIDAGELLHNRHQGRSYCCFAVRDATGRLRCLDNHQIDGDNKFLLGTKSVYSRDWQALTGATEAFVAEGIIDYLSMKVLEGAGFVGLALLGNQLIFDEPLLSGCTRIISALDGDRGGTSAFVDLMERYPDKVLTQYPLDGCKDPNELLRSGRRKARRLSADEKLQLYRAFQKSGNKRELARKWGIDRSYLYEVIGDIEKLLLEGLSSRRPGRPRAGCPRTIQDALEQIDQLQEHNRQLGLDRDKSICREEFLKLRLKWSLIEAAELRGEPVDEQTGPLHKSQIKKKRKSRRAR